LFPWANHNSYRQVVHVIVHNLLKDGVYHLTPKVTIEGFGPTTILERELRIRQGKAVLPPPPAPNP
jgi:hypothetical protein